jgi:hypothetical protein
LFVSARRQKGGLETTIAKELQNKVEEAERDLRPGTDTREEMRAARHQTSGKGDVAEKRA